MPIAVALVLSCTDDLLSDVERLRWNTAERVRWINEAVGAIMKRRPAALAVRTVIELAQGSYQSAPAGCSQLLDIVCNIAANGTTEGTAIRRTDAQLLDDADADWRSGTAKAKIRNYTVDDRAPNVFNCYPPAIAGTKVAILQAVMPTAVVDEDDTIDIGAEYLESVNNFVVYRANSKDSQYANGAAAMAAYQAFESSLGIQSQAASVASPNRVENSV